MLPDPDEDRQTVFGALKLEIHVADPDVSVAKTSQYWIHTPLPIESGTREIRCGAGRRRQLARAGQGRRWAARTSASSAAAPIARSWCPNAGELGRGADLRRPCLEVGDRAGSRPQRRAREAQPGDPAVRG